jgi:stalled ribosome alternative rescue factor ArfA
MKTLSFTLQLPRQRRRAVELYSRDTPFRPKVEQNRTVYNRKVKHRNRDESDKHGDVTTQINRNLFLLKYCNQP